MMRKFINLIEDVLQPQALFEVVLFNPVENVLTPYLAEITDENVKKWFLTVFRNWLLKQPNDLYQLPYLPPTANEKQQKAFSFKDLWDVRISTKTATLISHLIDFYNAHPNLPRLERMSVENVERAAETWIKQMNARAKRAPDDPKQVKLLMTYPNGFSMVELTGANALGKEGERMGHCVGGYCEYITSGQTRIFSLRDASNMPHATIELNTASHSINQIKGRQNRAPVSRYWPMIREFLESIQAVIERDYKNVGLLQIRDDDGGTITITQDQFRDMILDPNDERGQRFLNSANLRSNLDEDTALGLFVSLYGSPRLTDAVVIAAFAWNASLAVQHVAAAGGDKFTPEQLVIALKEVATESAETIKEMLRVTKPDATVIKQVMAGGPAMRGRGNSDFMMSVAQELPQVYFDLLDSDPDFLAAELAFGGTRGAGPFYVFVNTDKLTNDMIDKAFCYTPSDAFKRIRKLQMQLSDEQTITAIKGILKGVRYDTDPAARQTLDALIAYTKPSTAILTHLLQSSDVDAESTAALLTLARKHVPDQISQDVTEHALVKIDDEDNFKEYFKVEPQPTTYLQKYLFNARHSLLHYVQIIDPVLWSLVYETLRPEAVDPMETKHIAKKGRDGKPVYVTKNGYKQTQTYAKQVKKSPETYNSETTRHRRQAQATFLNALDPMLREPLQAQTELLDPAAEKMLAAQHAFASMNKLPLFNIAIKHLNREAELSSVGTSRSGWGNHPFNPKRLAELSTIMRVQELAKLISSDYDSETRFGIFMQAAPTRVAELLRYWYSKAATNHGDPWGKFKMPMDKDTAFAALSNVWESNLADVIKDRFTTVVLSRFKPSPANLLTMLKTADNEVVTLKIMKKTKKPSPELLTWVAEKFPAVIYEAVPLSAISDQTLAEIFESKPKLIQRLMDRDIRSFGQDGNSWGTASYRRPIDRNSDVFQRYAAAAKAAGQDAMLEKYAHQAELDDTYKTHDTSTVEQNLPHYNGRTLIKLENEYPKYLPMFFKTFAPAKIATLIDAGLLTRGGRYSGSGNSYIKDKVDFSGISRQKLEQVADAFSESSGHGQSRGRFVEAILQNEIPLSDPFIVKLMPLARDTGTSGNMQETLAGKLTTDDGKNAVSKINAHLMGSIRVPTKEMVRLLYDNFGKRDKHNPDKIPYYFKEIVDAWFRTGGKYDWAQGAKYSANPVAATLLKDEAIKRGGDSIRITKRMFQLLAAKRKKEAAREHA